MGLFDPKSFVEGGLKTVNTELTWKDCRFGVAPYTKKDGTPTLNKEGKPIMTVAALITYELPGDSEEDVMQMYSIGDPGRYEVSKDGKKLVSDTPITKGCNFALLMESLINAGFPENKLAEMEDISSLNGMVTYNIGVDEPVRQGLAPRANADGRKRIITVPSEIRKLPWEKKKSAPKKSAAAKADDSDTKKQFLDFVGSQVDENDGEVTKQVLAQAAFSNADLASVSSEIASLLYNEDGAKLLADNGFDVDGDTITRSE
jgi:hypothetical protein